MRGEFVDLNDTRLYCFAAGSRGAGEPIVLLHGAFTSSHVWRDLIARLPKGHRVLVIDLLGHGRSDTPLGADYSVLGHANRTLALLHLLGVEPACFVGHGFGAAVATAIALRSPNSVTRLQLCNPCHIALDGHAAHTPAALRRLARGARLWKALPPDWLASALHTAMARGYTNALLAGQVLDVYLKPFRTANGNAVAMHQLQVVANSDDVLSLGPETLSMPTGLMLGANDPFLPRSGERMRSAITAAAVGEVTVHRLAGMSHAIPEEAPDRLAIAVAELLVQ